MKCYIPEIDNVNIDLSSKRLILDTSLESSKIQQLIEQTLDTNVVLLGTSKRFGSNQLLSNQQLSDTIGPIDPPLSYDDLNLDKCHLKSSFIATTHTISGTGVGTKFVEKLESSGISVIDQVFFV